MTPRESNSASSLLTKCDLKGRSDGRGEVVADRRGEIEELQDCRHVGVEKQQKNEKCVVEDVNTWKCSVGIPWSDSNDEKEKFISDCSS